MIDVIPETAVHKEFLVYTQYGRSPGEQVKVYLSQIGVPFTERNPS